MTRAGVALPVSVVGGEGSGPGDAGLVLQDRGHDRGADVEEREELVGVARHSTADHEQVGPQEILERSVVGLEPLNRPLAILQALAFLGARGGARLGVVAVEASMCPISQLGIRTPLWMRAMPIPVPRVVRTTRPERPFAAP